jgi:hypothetical protein
MVRGGDDFAAARAHGRAMNTTRLRMTALATGAFAMTTMVGAVAPPVAPEDAAARLAIMTHHPTAVAVTTACRMLSPVLLVPALVAVFRLLPGRGSRIGVAAAALLLIGHTAGAAVTTVMAVQGFVLAPAPDRSAAVAAAKLIDKSLLWQLLCVLYLIPVVLGFLLLGIALWRGRAVPRAIAACVGLGLIVHISVGDLKWTSVSGAVMVGVGLGALALTTTGPVPGRTPSGTAELMVSTRR